MADAKLSSLPSANVVNKGDLFYLVQNDTSLNVSAGTVFASIIDPTLAGNVLIGGNTQVLNSAGQIDITKTRTDLIGGITANTNAIANGTVLPSTIYLYTTGVSATGRGLTFTSATGAPVTKTFYVTYANNKIQLSTSAGFITYPPGDWDTNLSLSPFPDGLHFVKGYTYIFDVSDATNAGNVLALSTSIDGTNTLGTEYTANVTRNGTPGTSGANIIFHPANVSVETGGRAYLDIPGGSDGQLKIITLVSTQGGTYVVSSNIKNDVAIEFRKPGDSVMLMYTTDSWTILGSTPGFATTFSGTSDNVPEGSKLYFTNARARSSITAGDSSIIYDVANGIIKANVLAIAGLVGNVGFSGNTNAITEGSVNLYYSNDRVNAIVQPSIAELRALATKYTSNVIYVAKNGDDANSGNTMTTALANIHTALAKATEWTTVFVKSGDYKLYNQPVTIPKRVALIGDNLRTTTVRPSNVTQDMFYVNNACYVTGFTFRDHQSPSAVFSYNPDGSAGYITTSPYIQNSSSITTTGTGMRVDGRYVSGLRSMVCDSYTQTNEGGIGIHMLHRGYTQLVSVFTICCHYGILCEAGGFCSITNSNSSFGTYALYADGVSEPLYYGKLTHPTIGQSFEVHNLPVRPNYGDSVLFANFNNDKCSRDTGLIVDSLAIDLAYGSNTQSNFAALQYWAQSTTAIPNQAPETIAAFTYAKNLATNIVANVVITSPYQTNVTQIRGPASNSYVSNIINSEFELIANIITGGTAGITDRIVPNQFPQNTTANILNASNLLYLNNAFIKAEVVAYVSNVYPGFFANANNFVDVANAQSRCSRDTGYLLDSVRFDLLHGGNRQAIMSGTYYYNYSTSTNVIIGQSLQTAAGYQFIGNIIANILTETSVIPGYPPYNVAKCTRDTGLIVDSLGIDLAFGSNTQATFAGLQYWAQTSSAIPNQSPETLAAITYTKNLTTNVLANVVVTGTYQNTYTQTFRTAKGTTSEANIINAEFDLIANIISGGTVGVTDRIIPNGYVANTNANVNNAANLINLNRTFIQNEVYAYVNTTYPGFFANANNFVDVANASTRCQRDVGYMLDSVEFDMLYGGNRQAIHAGTYYYNYSTSNTQIKNEIVQTGAAYAFIGQLVANVLTNTQIPLSNLYQTAVTQNTTAAAAATSAEISNIITDINLITNIINNGPNVAPPKVAITGNLKSDTNITNATKILFANKNFIIAEVLGYTNTVLFDLPYGNAILQNTSVTTAATYAEANLVLQNINLISNIITQGPSVAAPKTSIQYNTITNANLSNGAKIILANKEFIKAEVLNYVNKNWANISNGSGTFYTVKAATPLVGNTSTITLLENITTTISANISISFHQGSYISASGQTMEYVGSGDTIATALPYLGGVPIQANEVTQTRGGKVFFTSTDQLGDFRIGTGLVINRVDGTISGRTFNKALFAVMTPYILAIEG